MLIDFRAIDLIKVLTAVLVGLLLLTSIEFIHLNLYSFVCFSCLARDSLLLLWLLVQITVMLYPTLTRARRKSNPSNTVTHFVRSVKNYFTSSGSNHVDFDGDRDDLIDNEDSEVVWSSDSSEEERIRKRRVVLYEEKKDRGAGARRRERVRLSRDVFDEELAKALHTSKSTAKISTPEKANTERAHDQQLKRWKFFREGIGENGCACYFYTLPNQEKVFF